MEKRAEAKITKASLRMTSFEPAKMLGDGPISPNKLLNYMIAFFMGLAVPFGYLWTKNALNNTIESQDELEHLTNSPVLGKILHNRYKTKNVMLEFPKSDLAESIRALRTNLDFYVRAGQRRRSLLPPVLRMKVNLL
jgi:hypothetical protein